MAEANRAEQIITSEKEDPNTYFLKSGALADILEDIEVANLPVVLLSIAGGFRKGKSFLLGYIIRYLEFIETNPDVGEDWVGDLDAPLGGFSWRYGAEKETTGMLMWSKVYKIKTTKYGTVAVVLLDTEGSFDHTSTTGGNTTIFSLSVLVSSVQVYNLMKMIDQSDMQHLQLFAEYASMAVRESGSQGHRQFQKLVILVRDWSYPDDKPYGLEGGSQVLQKWVNPAGTRNDKVRDMRKRILSSFERIDCYLMPDPGTAVSRKSYDGKYSVLSDDFKLHLGQLVRFLVSPEKLVPKTINGALIKCHEFVRIFQIYFAVFEEGKLQEPQSLFNATAYLYNKKILDELIDMYKTEMQEALSTCSLKEIKEKHENMRSKCLDKLGASRIMGGNIQELRQHLAKEIDLGYKTVSEIAKVTQAVRNSTKEDLEAMQKELSGLSEKYLQQAKKHQQELLALSGLQRDMPLSPYSRIAASSRLHSYRLWAQVRKDLVQNHGGEVKQTDLPSKHT
ncbi:atlastin-2-like [Ornithodoros turicata]|uniref:atlastin-2-like n=1 Tax=Ornithodoros turicata TaxID=34597 RepID=UPI0031389662